MTDKPNIAALRIDERLVHGQGQLWIKTLGVNTVIVAMTRRQMIRFSRH